MVSAFELRLAALREWPEKKLIYELTGFAEHHVESAHQVVDVLTARIRSTDPANSGCKLPTLYLIDSIIRNVGGPYLQLFSAQLAPLYALVWADANEKDRMRLDYLLSTWEVRRNLSSAALVAMRTTAGSRRVTLDKYPHLKGAMPFRKFEEAPGTGGDPTAPTTNSSSNNGSASANGPSHHHHHHHHQQHHHHHSQQHQQQQQPAAPMSSPEERARREQTQSFQRAVSTEMNNLLEKMNRDSGRAALTVDALQYSNRIMYQQMRKAAEDYVHRAMDAEMQSMAMSMPMPAPGQGVPPVGAAGAPLSAREIHGFVSEKLVLINLDRAEKVQQQLGVHAARLLNSSGSGGDDAAPAAGNAVKMLLARLSAMLKDVNVPPPLPKMVHGLLPPKPAPEFVRQHAAESLQSSSGAAPAMVIPVPKFRTDNLERDIVLKETAMRAFFAVRKYACEQDGQRFRTQREKAEHLDQLFERNKDKVRRESLRERVCRPWNCSTDQWVTDFNSMKIAGAAGGAGSGAAGTGDSSNASGHHPPTQDGLHEDEECILLADENFPRCPVSKELFDNYWDEEESEIYYRNAVKVLLTPQADQELYKLSRPTAKPNLHYSIVHKALVLDGWLASGRATTIRKAVLHYRGVGRDQLAEDLLVASGVAEMLQQGSVELAEEEQDVTFVLLEPLQQS